MSGMADEAETQQQAVDGGAAGGGYSLETPPEIHTAVPAQALAEDVTLQEEQRRFIAKLGGT